METTNKFDIFKKDINTLIDAMATDADKFYNKEQKAAGVRLRKSYKAIKQLVQTASNETSPKK
jgi:hypothetical protein